jgi:hypothetical protein
MKTHHERMLWVMLINRNGLLGALFLAASGISASVLFGVGCGLNFGPQKLYCDPDGGDCANFPECCDDAGTGIAPQSLKCEDRGGECVERGTADFEKDAILLWIGDDDLDAPKCPERASSDYYTGYADLVVEVQCDECKCSEPTCVLPHAIGVDPQLGCASGVMDNYAAPNEWDGSCYSPAKLPAGSFASFNLPSATVLGCTPSSSPPIKPPSAMAPRSSVIFGGIGWRKMAKACAGTAYGECSDSGKTCVPSAEPPPPDFRYCVKYQSTNVDETKLPQCPAAFTERHVFYGGMEGKRECSECKCSEPIGSQCIATFSAYQDPACGNVPTPFFKEAVGGVCNEAMPWSLGAISAKMAVNAPGKCDPIGGEPVGEVKPSDPRVFCCQPLPEKSSNQ